MRSARGHPDTTPNDGTTTNDDTRQIAFVTTDTAQVAAEDTDRHVHDEAFASLGIGLDHKNWWDVSVDWETYDLIVIRSTWDYCDRLDEFFAWLDRVDVLGTVLNPPPIIRWNIDKRYLVDLAACGVPVVPTTVHDTVASAQADLAGRGSAEVVVKPAISAGSRMTGRFTADDPKAVQLAVSIIDDANAAMVQPAIASVAERGEIGAVMIDGTYSHAFSKGPILASGGGVIGGAYKEEIERAEPTAAEFDVVDRAASAVASICRQRFGVTEPLLYGRYDLALLGDGSPVILEAELFEPHLFLHTGDGAADRFAKAVLARLAG